MAICSTRIEPVSRSKGHNVVAAAAYRRAEIFKDERLSTVHDYSKKKGIIYSDFSLPENSFLWVEDLRQSYQNNAHDTIEKFWNDVDKMEKRKDSQLARNLYFALPIELNASQNIELMKDCMKTFTCEGMMADWSIHFEAGNPHAHVLLTMREITENGFGKKVEAWNDWGKYKTWRFEFANITNTHLALHGIDARIDPRSYKEQGIDLRPTKHMGKKISSQEARGIETERLIEQREIQHDNLSLIQENPAILFDAISRETSTFSSQKIAQTLSRYVNPHDEAFSVFTPDFLQTQQVDYATTLSPNEHIVRQDALTNFSEESISEPLPERQEQSLTSFEKILKNIECHESVFSERDVAREVFKLTPDAELFATTLATVRQELRQNNQILSLGIGDDGREKFTTRELFNVENNIQKMTDKLRKRTHVKLSKKLIKEALRQREQETGKKLTPEQMIAVLHMTSKASLSCLVGRAGTGKSFTVGSVKTIYEAAGFRVQGLAPSGVVAEALTKDAGIEARTIASFQESLKKGHRTLNESDVIILDEAGMADSHSIHFVMKTIQKAGAKLILLGDPAQLQPVGPGAIFRAILDRIGRRNYAMIREVYRQKEIWQQEATQQFAIGDTATALSAYHEKGCVHLNKTHTQAMTQLVADWKTALDDHQDPSQQLVIAFENKDVRQLNQALRQVLVDSGQLSEGYTLQGASGSMKIAKGERLVFLENNFWFKVSNGSFGTVTSVDFLESGQVRSFAIRLDGRDKDTLITPKDYQKFDYGYASTVHKSQGITKGLTFIYAAGRGWNRALSYVAMTRHKIAAHLYAAQSDFPTLTDLFKSMGRFVQKDSVLDYPLNFARRRGIEPNAEGLRQHLGARLIRLKDNLNHHYQRWKDPFNYAVHLMQQREAIKRDDLRQEAVIVAAYADHCLEANRLGKLINGALKEQEFTWKSPDIEQERKTSPHYAAYLDTKQNRDRLAASIVPRLNDFKLAIELNRLDVDVMKRHAEHHRQREEITAYQVSLSSKHSLVAQKMAAHLMSNIKPYYRELKALNVDIAKLSNDAKTYHQRVAKSVLTPDERKAFDRVALYQNLVTQSSPLIAKLHDLYHAEKHPEAIPVIQEKLMALNKQKSRVAAEILENREVHSKGLDYFEIGKGIDRYRAQKRWVQLQQAAHFYVPENSPVVAISAAKTHTSHSRPHDNSPHQPRFIDVVRLKEDLNHNAESVAAHYLGQPKKQGAGQWRYGDKKGSLFVTVAGQKQGYWYDFQTAEGGDMLSLISHSTGKNFKDTLLEAAQFLGGESRYLSNQSSLTPEQIAHRAQKHQQVAANEEALKAKKLQHVREIAEGTKPIKGTLAERYLKEHRRIMQPLNSDNLRFHPALKNWVTGDVLPALVVLVHDEKNQLSGLQATFLDPVTANKASLDSATKLSRGTIAQGSIVHHAVNAKTSPPQPVIALAEGLETALSVARAHPDWEVRLSFGVSNFEKVAKTVAGCSKDSEPENREKLLSNKALESVASVAGVARPTIIICADNDGANSGTAKAVNKAIENLNDQSVTVQVIEPTKPEGVEKWDFNDLLKKSGVAAVKNNLDQNNVETEKNASTTFTEEQTHKYEIILKKFHQLRKEDPNSEATHRQAYRMAELPNIKRYVEIKHPNDLPLIQEGYKKHIQRALNHLDLSSEKIDKFDIIIKKYETLKKQYQANLSDNKAKEALQNHATKMSQLTRVMAYLHYRHPQYSQEVRGLAREREQAQDIDR